MKNNLGKISASTALSALIILGLVSHIDTADAKAQKKGSLQEFNENYPGFLPAGAVLVVGGLLIGGGYMAYNYKMKSDEKAAQKQPLIQVTAIPANRPNSNTPNSSAGNNSPEASEPTESLENTGLDETIDETATTPTASSEASTAENTPASPTEDVGTENAEDKSIFSRALGKIKGKYGKHKQENIAKKQWLETKRIELAAEKDRQDQEARRLSYEQGNVDRAVEKVTNDLTAIMKKEKKLNERSDGIDEYAEYVKNIESKVNSRKLNQYHKSIRERKADVIAMNDLEAKIRREGVSSREDHESLEKLKKLEALRKQTDEQEAFLKSMKYYL